MKIFDKNSEKGFTLIEVMISIGLFTVIMIIGITAILGVNNTYRKSRTMRSAIDNLSFIMEDMARNIRLGSRYRCLDSNNISLINIEDPLDGENCQGIAFEPFWDPVPENDAPIQDQVIYFFDVDDNGFDSIFKSMDGGVTFSAMNSLDVKIDLDKSGFAIFGSQPDSEQPSVRIILNGEAVTAGNSTNFNLQTTVSQRLLDYPPNP